MRFLEITALVATLFNFALTCFVLSRNLRSTLNKVYFGWGLSMILWNLGAYRLFGRINGEQAFVWAKVLQLGVIFMPVSLLHLSLLIAQISARRLVVFLYALHAGFACTLLTGHFILGVRPTRVGYWSVPGPVFWVYLASYIGITTTLVFVLYRRQKSLAPLHRSRIRYLLWAICGLWVFGSNDLLPIIGVDQYPFTSIDFFPFGNVAAVFYVVIVGYSVLQFQLLDIHVVMGRLAAQIVRLLFISLIGLLFMLVAARFAPQDQGFNNYTFFISIGILVGTVLVSSFFFPKFFGKGDEKIERRILGDRFEYQERVAASIQAIRSITDVQLLKDELHHLLVLTMRVKGFQIIVLDEATRGYSMFESFPAITENQPVSLSSESPVFELFRREKLPYLAFKIAYAMPGETTLERTARTQFREFDPEFCFPFYDGAEVFGFLLLGEKSSGEPFTPHDVNLVKDLVQGLSIVLNQIRLNRQVQQAKEMELLGYMSAGLAHDLNNLLTPVRTFQQFFAAGMPKSDAILELLPVAMRNLDTVQSYIREALFFSRTQSLNLKQTSLEEVIQSALKLVEPAAREKQIKVELVPSSGDSDVEMDDVLILRLFGNLLSNAIDASPSGTVVQAVLLRLPRTEISRDWYRIQVVDKGEGISKENLKRIMMPYFSTKNQGDGKRGFGLGLAIARKIVHLHHGNLYIASEERKGTTVQVDLPSKQNTQPAPLKTPTPVPG